MTTTYTRRQILAALAAGSTFTVRLNASGKKPLRGVFPIVATPFTEAKAVDFDDLAKEVDFLDRCGVHGMVWPQLASEYWLLTKEERFRGMEALDRAMKGRRPALVLGVQAPNTGAMLEYARHAEKLGPDAMIAIPPAEAKTLDDFLDYYRALARVTKRPIFIQTSGGAKDIDPKVEALVALAREFPNCAYVKEEYPPIIPRMIELARNRPPMRGVFSGNHGRGWMHEMRLGLDGTMPASPLADVYVRVWDLYQAGRREEALEVFSKLLLLINLDGEIPGTLRYIMKKRGIFKTTVSRLSDARLSPEAIEEIEFTFAALKRYLRMGVSSSC
mgnify:CR=1 FL=1